ncbi:MAG: stringent starvation protein A [Gammaproteobacteria bacterium]|nr:stringent starvation protein A [Gammaproteobacteria bacterium]
MKRSVMTLYSGGLDIYSHQVRIVLAEKGVGVDVLNVDINHPSEDLAELNPYNSLPTLVDRELVLYQANIIMEYLDERFPHPPLLPVYPVARARSRLMVYRIDHDWYKQVRIIEMRRSEQEVAQARKELREGLVALIPVFNDMPYFLSEEFTLVDCVIAPLLWRLSYLGVSLPRNAKPIVKYAERVFNRDAFQASLTEAERELRETDVIK